MIDVNIAAENVIELVALACVNAACLVILVVVVLLLFSKCLAPKHRHWLWLLVAIRLVLPVSAGSALSLFNFFDAGARSELPREAAQTLQTSTIRVGLSGDAPRIDPVPDARPVEVTQANSGIELNRNSVNIEVLLFGIWFFGATLVSVWTVGNTLSAAIRIRHATRVDDLRLQTILDECRRQMRVRKFVQLRLVSDAASPAIAGMLRPNLLMPADMADDFTDEELRLIFLHELAHLKRADVLVNWLLAGIRIVHWFNPLFWFAAGRIFANREMACDALALECAGAASQRVYGETLLRVAERSSHPASRCSAANVAVLALFSRKGLLKRRITMLPALIKSRGIAARVFALVLVASAAIVGLTDGISKAKDEPSDPKRSVQTSSDEIQAPTTPGPAGGPTSRTVQKIYDVTRIREHFNKLPVPAHQTPDAYFTHVLFGAIQLGSLNDEIGLLSGNQLTVKAHPRDHERLQSLLKLWEETGIPSLSLTVQIISTPKDIVEQAGITWSRLEAPQVSPSRVPHSLFTEKSDTPRTPVAEYVSARIYSVLSETLTSGPRKRFLELAQAGEKPWVITAPKMTIVNGQTADIADVVSRPYVVGIRDAGDGHDEPEYRMVEEGTRIQLRGLIREKNGPVRLDCMVQLNSVDDVKTASFRLGGAGRNVKVQVPAVTTERFHINTEIPLGQSLLISPLRTDDDKKCFYILIDAELASPPVVRKS